MKITTLLRTLTQDTLYSNSFFLMLATVVMAGFGIVFWFICARVFSPNEIGVATTLISAMTLISYISLLGFNSTFIRVLPTSKNRNNEVNTGLILSLGLAVVVAGAYVLAIPWLAPALMVVRQNIFYAIGFVVMVAMAANNLLTDSIFIAYRAARFNLLVDGFIMGGVKLVLPLLFVGLGAYGVFASSGMAAVVGMLFSIFFLIKKFDFAPKIKIDRATLATVFHYSFGNYMANLLNIAPTLVLPLIIINRLGSASAGYFYLAFMVANLLYTVAYSVCQSLFAEGSYTTDRLWEHTKKSLVIMGALLVPGSLALYFLAPVALELFGQRYEPALGILQLFAMAGIPVAGCSLVRLLLRIKKYIKWLIVLEAVYFATISVSAWAWIDQGLLGVGRAWLVGNIVAGIVGAVLFIGQIRRDRRIA